MFARARGATSALVALFALAVLGVALGDAALRLGQRTTYNVPWVVLVPMLAGAVVGLAASSPLRWIEDGSARSIALAQALHTLLLLALAALASAIGSSGVTGPLAHVSAVRNAVGFAGLACLSASLLGGTLGWVLPVAFGLVALSAGTDAGHPRTWAWPLQPDRSNGSLSIAVVLALIGVALMALRNTRERDRDEQ